VVRTVTSPDPFVSYAQHGEDVILWRALGDRDGVFYVDVGAFDPTFDSVTRALYERGWHGVNIEAQPDRLTAFEAARPLDTNLGLAMGDRDGTTTLTLRETPGWASTLPPDVIGADPTTSRGIDVPMRRLDTLLADLGVEHVDVLKIDVEGAEPAVVRGLLGGPVRPLVCVVEGVAPGLGRTAGDEAVGLLVAAGYQHCLFDGLNHYLTIDPDLVAALSVPANPLDGHTTAALVGLVHERSQLHATIAALAAENLGLRSVPTEVGPQPDGGDDGTGTPQPAGTSDHAETDQSGEPIDDAASSYGGGDLPVPVDDGPDLPDDVEVPIDPFVTGRIPRILDTVVRAERRRKTFGRRLRGAAVTRTRPAHAEASIGLLELVVRDREPGDAVKLLYREVLGREADADGLAGWSSRLEAGESALVLGRELADSAEAQDRPVDHRTKVRTALRTWESLVAIDELGAAAWRTGRPYQPGTVAHQVFVRALFEVGLRRQPTADELEFEVAKLVGGAGREWLLRAYAGRPDVVARLLGDANGLRGRLRRWRNVRGLIATFREQVVAAESRQIALFLDDLRATGPILQDGLRAPATTTEER